MMIIFGICLILGALVAIVLGALSFGHLLVIALGAGLIAINLIGERIPLVRGAGKTIVSVLAIGLFTFLLMGNYSDTELMDRDTAAIIDEADELYEDKGLEPAIKLLQDKNNDLGWNRYFRIRIAELYAEEELYPESARAYGEVLRNLPDDLSLRMTYAKALFTSGDYNGAHREVTHIIRIDPERAEAYVLMGDLYQVWNDYFRETYYYRIALGIDETSVANRVKLAEAYGRTHSYEEAVMEYELAKEYAKTPEEEALVYESYLRFSADGQDE